MLDWGISAEIFSLITLSVLMMSFYEKRLASSYSSRIFSKCLHMSAAAILLNLLCVFLLASPNMVPRWLNYILNSVYFLIMLFYSSNMAYYLLYLAMEYVYDRKFIRRANILIWALFAVYALLIVINVRTGIIFSIDAAGAYHRGPGINIGYAVMGMQLLLVLICTWKNFSSVSRPMIHVLRILPSAVALLTAYQIAFPNILLNGSLMVIADLIMLLNFQSRRIEVDSLTWVNNRSSFYQEVNLRLAGGQRFQIIVVSMRHFTYINQNYGHKSGDSLLIKAASWLSGLRNDGQTFRMGNVEFALLLPYNSPEEAENNLSAVYERFNKPWMIGAVKMELEPDFAELIHTDQPWDATDIMEFLQFSLSEAKKREEHLLRFDNNAYLELEKRRHILQLLHKTIEEKSLEVWYQPIYNCADGTFSSAEALMHLKDENGEVVPTGLFVSIAEECGLLDEISWLLLEQVCSLLGSGRIPGLKSISVNLSMQQFMSDTLLERVKSDMALYDVPPSMLKIEITERVFAKDPQRMRRLMEGFSRMNVEFYLDDFGTGYSNMATVLDLPFGCIKLDRELICALPEDKKSCLMVGATLQLFHNIGCKVVAEGVEREEQAKALIDWGVDWLQGFYFSRPLPVDRFIEFLEEPVDTSGLKAAGKTENSEA